MAERITGQTDRQTDSTTDRQTDRQTDRSRFLLVKMVLSTHAELASATARGRSYCETAQISYAPKALDRSLAAYLRCDLKANVFVYPCNCCAYL